MAKRKEARSLQNQIKRLRYRLQELVELLTMLRDEDWLRDRGLLCSDAVEASLEEEEEGSSAP